MNPKVADSYIKARQEYDEITHNINASKRNWQRMSFVLGLALTVSITSNIFTIKRAHVIPYIVQVDNIGRALAVNEAKEEPMNDQRVIKAFVYQYIDMSRSVIPDPEALRKNLSQVYRESIRSVQRNFLDPFYKDNNPFDYAQQKGTKHIELLVFLKEARNTYSVEWREIERNYDNQVLGESHYKALVSVIQIPPVKEDQYREDPLNPFGLYVTSLSWARLT
ncbi:MAG: type IV secretion system protein [Candidatus Omnitrophica bacterium]|nr:type IV secretion system protein [Candidatus Omnitrophota bacterium]MDE2222023.1 type IV secretion system protein [Candidatus Omnitrophota bacterium]